MTPGEAARRLDPLLKAAEALLGLRELFLIADEVERGRTSAEALMEKARAAAAAATAQFQEVQGRLEAAKADADTEAARYRKERIEGLERQREDVRQAIVRLNAEQEVQRARLAGVQRQASEAERDHQQATARRREEIRQIDNERQVRMAERQAEIERLDREIKERQEAYRGVIERIAALAPR